MKFNVIVYRESLNQNLGSFWRMLKQARYVTTLCYGVPINTYYAMVYLYINTYYAMGGTYKYRFAIMSLK